MQEPLAAAVVGLPTRGGLNEFDAILGGAIVNMSSIHGSVTTGLGASAYTAAKHGVVSLTKPAGVDYGPRGVRVNAVGPAYIERRCWRACRTRCTTPSWPSTPWVAWAVPRRSPTW
ncbi:3-oxoacyl-ACP reductase [Streptococcus pneumoniae]|nr:3-oxoacyl-ACP reductase [Streptococcus pneumoniae]